MSMKNIRVSIMVLALAAPVLAQAQTAPAQNLPSLALNPPDVTEPSPWKGLSFGTAVFASFGKGAKGHIGGEGFIGYDHALANNFTIGVTSSVGYVPVSFAHSPYKGLNFSTTQVKLGYDMGPLHPYVTGGLMFTRPNANIGGPAVDQSINDLFASSKNLKTSGTFGAGVDYQINNQLSVGVGVQVSNGPVGLLH